MASHTKKTLTFWATAMIGTVLSCAAIAAECTIDSNELDRGEKKSFLICGADITSDYALDGLAESGIIAVYQQYLGRCAADVKEPGLYMVLEAERQAAPASLRIQDKQTGAALCHDLTIDVPSRQLLTAATLTQIGGAASAIHRLTITADATVDLSRSCSDGLAFPEGKWPTLSILSEADVAALEGSDKLGGGMPVCTESSLTVPVEVYGEQRYPAKIVIPTINVNGNEAEGIAYVKLPEPAWASSMKPEDAKYIDVDNIRTRYYEKGSGDALLLVHGGQPSAPGSNAWTWIQNFDDLSKSFHVYSLDRIAQGYTDNLESEEAYAHYYERVVEHLYGFIKALGLEKVSLIGHSQGGWPVTRIAVDHPELVTCLIDVDTSLVAPADPKGGAGKFYMYQTTSLHPKGGQTKYSLLRGAEFFSVTYNNITEAGAEKTLAIARSAKFAEAAAHYRSNRMSPAHPSYRVLKEALLQDLRDGKLKVPTLIVWGHNDPEGSYGSGVELFNIISATNPHSAMHVFANTGHSAFKEYPDRFNRLVVSFCGS